MCCVIAKAQSFAPAVNYPVSSSPQNLVLGDFNRDGRLDVVTVNSSASVSVLNGNGDGTFQPKVDYPTGPQPQVVAKGDFNNDGKLDLVVNDYTASGGYQTFSALLGNGDGTFNSRISFGPGSLVTNVVTGDFNGDGRDDVLTLNSSIGTVSVNLSNGDGTFTSKASYSFLRSTRQAVIRDFDRDGKIDVAVTVESSNPANTGVAILIGNGDGTLRSPALYSAATDLISQLTAGDLNGDGNVDLLATSTASGRNISFLRGNGDGTFQPRVDTQGASFDGLSVADLDNNGTLDVLTLQGPNGRLGFLSGNGDGTLRLPFKEYLLPGSATAVEIGDLNGDGKPDVITNGVSTVNVLINQSGPRVIQGIVTNMNGGGPLDGVSVTITGGVPVTVITGANGAYSFNGLAQNGNYTISPSRPNYSFTPQQQTFNGLTADQTANFSATLATYTISGIVRDSALQGVSGVNMTLSGGASATAVTGSDGRYSFTGLAGNGTYTVTPSFANSVFGPSSQTFTNLSFDRTANFSMSLATYYINVSVRDPNSSAYPMPPTVSITGAVNRTNAGIDSSFTGLPVGGNYTISVGQTDAPFSNFLLQPPLTQSINNLSSNQSLNFNVKTLAFAGAPNSYFVATGDFNGDGKIDVLSESAASSSLRLLLGNGDGTLVPGSNFSAGQFPARPVVGDFNRDGKQDFAVVNGGDDNVSVFLGNGNGTFQSDVRYAVGDGPFDEELVDLNGDGKVDLVVANSAGHSVSVLQGNGDGTFQSAVTYLLGDAPGEIATGDFNGDSKADVIVGTFLLLGDGAGGFLTPTTFSNMRQPGEVTVADFNGDGKADVAMASGQIENVVAIYLGNGDGTFQPPANYHTTFRTSSVEAADLNGDGKLDLVLSSSAFITVLMGNSDGTFQDYWINFPGTGELGPIVVADFNGDGWPDLTFGNTLVNVLLNQMQTSLQVSAYTANESDGVAHVTFVRNGNTSSSSTISYRTIDDPSGVTCSTLNGHAYARCDYATAVDTVNFAPGETRKTITIPIIDDAYAEGTETFDLFLSESSGGVLSGKRTITITIIDNDSTTGSNPIVTSPFFVRQQYLDFLSREPEPAGFNAWTQLLNGCPDPNNVDPGSPSAGCDRITVSSSFFGSQEFQLKGFFVYRFYAALYGRLPTYNEMISDMRSVSGQTAAEVFAKRAAFAENFVRRQDFAFYNMTSNATFVAILMNRYNLGQITTHDPHDPEGTQKVTLSRTDLVSQLDSAALSRAQALRAIVESDEVAAAEFNKAFVAMQYFGYLRRDPETAGFNAWLNYLNAHPTDFRTMVNGFVNSIEYRLRFGNPPQ
ncbi:MAG: hypothetical protein C5B55_11685 [Blastocatellia bacterium]|nr:MAG: hypothetical protein C5B55_11685 [Blastocatellia bacterium]